MNNSRPQVLLTNPIHEQEHLRLAQAADVTVAPDTQPDTLRRLIRDAQVLIVRSKLPDDIFQHQQQLRGVIRHGVGLDMIPMAQACAHRIPVANIPGSNTASVVEYCVAAMLHFNRRLPRMLLDDPSRDWAEARRCADQAREINGLTLGIVGVGTIGRALASVAQALGMHVLGLTRRPETLPEGVAAADKTQLFRQSDIVVLSCPLTDETRGLVDASALACMKPDALLINVARGPVVDTNALLTALQEKRLRGAMLDVHDQQPIPEGLYPKGLEHLFLTPHVAAITQSSMQRMSRGAVDEALRLLDGQRFLNLVNPEIYQP
ncbi:NAD(P)-dependent oxidoreductase [Paracandidimonas soli]|uniref:NAD(P)-dependent oxidoreductase n=1 Tax=Paracandidimonas soli TaxID=1917182 RepID=UPI003341088F